MKTAKLILLPALIAAVAAMALAQPAAPAKAEPAKPAASAAKPGAAAVKAPAQRTSSYKNLKYPPLNKTEVPEPQRFELPSGMVVYLVEDHEFPMISISARIRAGSRWEPAEEAGLATITGSVMRTGGTATRPGDKLDEELDRLGAYVETSIGQDSGGASVSVLKEDSEKGIAILADILQHPAFPQDKIDLAKISQRDSIARRNDNPHGIFNREFNRVIYGQNSPYARQTEYATIDAITRDDLVAFHARFFQPENVILAAWGDFKAAELRASLEQAFSGWARGGKPKPEIPEVDPAAKTRTGIYSVNKADMEQSWVIMGMLGGKRSDPDYCALQVMNEVLGGGLSSRLFSNVRSAQALAYAVFSDWNAGWDRPRTFTAAGSTKPGTTLKIYNSIRHEIERMAETGATADELARAKEGILKGFAFESDNTAKIVNRLVNYEYYGYPKDFLQRYREGIDKVTTADVARVAKEYLKPENFAVLFLGTEKDYESPLSQLGSVTPIDITIPQPKGKALAAATPESIAKGKALLAKARDAIGGSALAKVKGLSSKGEVTVSTPQGAMAIKYDASITLAGKLLQKLSTPMGEMVMGYDGATAWMSMGGQTRDLPASQKAEMDGSVFRDSVVLLRGYESSAWSIQSLGPQEFDGKKLEAVAVSDPSRSFSVALFMEESGLIAGKRYTAAFMGGPPAETDEIVSDYHDIEGVKIPFKTITKQGGKVRSENTTAELKLNPGFDDSIFKKP